MSPLMIEEFVEHLRGELNTVREAGLYKRERVIASPQVRSCEIM